jgi:predicted phage-related endonuclease
MGKLILPKSVDDWRALRHRYVSSTESAALFGYSAYSTPFQLAVEKQAPEPPAWAGNERATWGLRLQEAIAKGISADYGVKVRRVNSFAAVDEVRMGASFDYEVVGHRDDSEAPAGPLLRDMYSDLGAGILEIKTVDRLIYRDQWRHEEGDEAPVHIELQVQQQLDCIDRPWSAIGVLIGGNEIKVMIREVDREVCYAIRAKVAEFWATLERGEMPPVTLPQDVDLIRRLYLNSDPAGVFQSEDPEVVKLCQAYVDAKAQRDYHEDLRKTYGARLLTVLGDAAKGAVPGFTIQANTVKETLVPATVRKPYRNLIVREKK